MKIKMCRERWSSSTTADGEVWTRGFAFYEGMLYKGEAFCALLLAQMRGDIASLAQFCAKLNGCFAFACQSNNQLAFAVDNVRSIELMYMLQPVAMVFDDVSVIGPMQRDQLYDQGVQEYLSAGYVIGDRTLFKDVYSLEAGMCGVIKAGVITKRRYFRYELLNEHGAIPDDFDEKMDHVFVETIDRLIKSCEGKRIVVPLSGGYDSRLIVSFLHRKGFKNVLCYSYGLTEAQDEARRSRQVAEALGYSWCFVKYGCSAFDKELVRGRMMPYWRIARGCTNRPHVQEFMAIESLSKSGVLCKNTDVIVPGFSFDMIAGSQVTKGLWRWNVVEKIVGREMYFWPLDGWSSCSAAISKLRMLESDLSAASFLEFVTWQERIAKFIVNSVRVYEYFGFEWRLPLWDIDLIRAWLELPQCYRRRRWYFSEWFSAHCDSALKGIPVANKGCQCCVGRLSANIRAYIPYRLGVVWDYSKVKLLLRNVMLGNHAKSFLGEVGDFCSVVDEYEDVIKKLCGQSLARRLKCANKQSGNAWMALISLCDFLLGLTKH